MIFDIFPFLVHYVPNSILFLFLNSHFDAITNRLPQDYNISQMLLVAGLVVLLAGSASAESQQRQCLCKDDFEPCLASAIQDVSDCGDK